MTSAGNKLFTVFGGGASLDPAISGLAFPGEELTSSAVGQWYVDDVATGSPATSYTPTVTDIGKKIHVKVGGVESGAVYVWHPLTVPEVEALFLAHDGPSPATDAVTVDTWEDLSPSGFDLTKSNTPTYDADGAGSYPAIVFNSTDYLDRASLDLLRNKAYGYIFTAAIDEDHAGGSAQHSVAYVKTAIGTARLAINTKISSEGDNEGVFARRLDGDEAVKASVAHTTGWRVRSVAANWAAGSLAYRRDGADVDTDVFASTGNSSDTAASQFLIGAGSNTLPGKIAAVMVVGADAALTSWELNWVEQYFGQLCGVSITRSALPSNSFIPQPADFVDSDEAVFYFGRIQPSAHGSLFYRTSADNVTLYPRGNVTSPEFGIFSDGVLVSEETIDATVGGTGTTVALPAGSNKLVEIRYGYQGKAAPTTAGAPDGGFLRLVEFDAAASKVTRKTSDFVVYGDSIATGSAASDWFTKPWFSQVRAAGQQAACFAWGGRALYSDGADLAGRQALAAKIAAKSPTKVWLAVGVNDYAFNTWSASAFGTAYASLLDEINALLPNATIYAQSPVEKTADGANGSGDTLQDYRDEISTAAAARAFVTYIDGTAIMSAANLSGDGIHPNDAGHTEIATAVLAAI